MHTLRIQQTMNNKEKIKFLEGVEDYYEKKQLFEFFENLLKKLLVKKPDNPLDFLIEQLENPTDKRIIFTVGLNWAKYKGLLDDLSKQFGLKMISTSKDSLFTGYLIAYYIFCCYSKIYF